VKDESVSLRHNLGVIMDEKYIAHDKFDWDHRSAQKTTKMVLKMLSDNAREKYRQTEQITQSLIRVSIARPYMHISRPLDNPSAYVADRNFLPFIEFAADTLKNQQHFEYVHKQYRSGPVVNQSLDKRTPYLNYLNKGLAESLVTFNNAVKDQDMQADWVSDISLSLRCGLFVTCWKINKVPLF
jgi:hypothetical protein